MWKIVLPGLAMIAVTYAFARLSFGLFLPDIASDLQLSESDGGLIGSLGYIAYSLALLVSSAGIMWFGQRKVNVLAGLTAVIGLLGISSAQSAIFLASSVFVAGLGSGLASPALSQIARQTLAKNQLDRGNTWINSGTSFGMIITGPIVLLFTEHWRLSYALFAVIAFAVLVWNRVSIPNEENKQETKGQSINWTSVLNQAKGLLFASIIVGISSSIYWTFSRSFLTVEHGVSANESVLFWVIMGIAGILGGVAGGFIQWIGMKWSYRLVLLALLSSIAILIVSSRLSIYLSASLFGGGYIFLTGLFIVWATKLFDKLPAVGVSISFLALGIGQSIGSFFAGKTIEWTSYPISFLLFALLGGVGLFITPLKKSMEEQKTAP
ncbi:MFS transporter [Shouchella sp. 1P09AA]|uniref:MFS transporter n=1 Tax=unclassified Shouchella TaxID=2893065 RepID=UPI0039A2DE31